MAAPDSQVETEPDIPRVKVSELTSDCEENSFKEFERLNSLLSQIPKKAQHGILKTSDLVLTCIDANKKHIALGTNIGITFLYSRKDESMQKLRTTNQGAVITSVCLHEGIDDLLAMGTASGDVAIFCLPGLISVQKKQIQKFDVQDLHKHYITCLAWSTNGMKLFSGDKNGHVVVTETDFYQGVSKSSSLLIESSTEITQIDYQHRVLLVSTRHRSFVVRLDLSSKMAQIGTQDRKMPGPFGAVFIPELCKPGDVKLYAARPGRRLWLADVEGNVKHTHIFPDPLASEVPEIPLLAAGKLQLQQEGFQFGKLLWLKSKNLVTWSHSALVVLDPVNNRCLCRQGRLSGVVDVAVVSETEEIFLLRRHADARVIRISKSPEAKAEVEPPQELPQAPPLEEETPASVVKPEEKTESSALLFFKRLSLPLRRHDAKPGLHQEEEKPGQDTQSSAIESQESSGLGGVSQPELSDKVGPPFRDGFPPTEVTREVSVDSGEGDTPPLADPGNEDIVFSHRMKKHKKKKHKEGISRLKESEVDTTSQESNDSIGSITVNEEDESTLKTLREADEMLSKVHNMITKESNRTSGPLPDVLPSRDKAGVPSLGPDIVELQNEKQVVNTHISKQQVKTLDIPDGILTSSGSDISENASSKNGSGKEIDRISNNAALEKDKRHSETNLSPPEDLSHKMVEKQGESNTPASDHGMSFSETYSSGDSQSPKIHPTSQQVYSNQLSEVDQHMKIVPELEYNTRDPVPELEYNTGDPSESSRTILDTVNSALARIGNVQDSKVDSTEKSLAKSVTAVSNPSREKRERFPLLFQQSFPDIYSEFSSIEESGFFKKQESPENASDDIYSEYSDVSPMSPESFSTGPVASSSAVEPLPTVDSHDQNTKRGPSLVANAWSEFTVPANIYSLAVSNNHVWFTDKSENIYYSSLRGGKGIVWRKATGYASQIAVSPSGLIVWRLHKSVVHAGTKISTRHPEGLKWVEAVRDVQYIAVSNSCAWYIKRTGELMVQQGLSKERPCYRSRQVDCGPYRLKQITCGGQGVVWAITEGLQLLVRTGVSDDLPAGEAWEACVRESAPYLFSHVAIDNENIGWAIDVCGQIWFCKGVTQETPKGTGVWFQIPMSGYVMQDPSMLDMIRAAAQIFDPTKLSYITSANRGGLVCAGSQGVWLAMDFRNLLQVCRGSIQGYHWMEAQLSGVSSASQWKHICASISHLNWGLVWAQQLRRDMFAFKKARGEANRVGKCDDLVCVAVAHSAVWALGTDGEIRIRTGMGPRCPMGTDWATLDLSQLGDAHFVHLSCNSSYVWAVEAHGGVYQRIGVGPPTESNLSPVWLPIDSFGDLVFTKVYVSPLDWMVWGVDNRRLCFVRVGITESMPIGKEWIHVPGIQAVDLAATATGVWALNAQGEIFFRFGISLSNPTGDYWKKIPGSMAKISASENDDLWGIDLEGQLMKCKCKILQRETNSVETFPAKTITRDMSVNEDWEIV